MADINETHMLITVYEKCLGHPNLKAIGDAAWTRLLQINAEHVPQEVKEPTPEEKAKPSELVEFTPEPEAEAEKDESPVLERRL